jgi:hypothetical protein
MALILKYLLYFGILIISLKTKLMSSRNYFLPKLVSLVFPWWHLINQSFIVYHIKSLYEQFLLLLRV